ncbi:MAG: TolC family protein [Spirochaetaceae bacterium]
MKGTLFLLLLPGVLIPHLVSAESSTGGGIFEELLHRRLRESVPYRQAALDRRSAELELKQLGISPLPYIDVSTDGRGLLFEDGEMQTYELHPGLTWTNILGTDIRISSPVRFEQESLLSSLRLNASRKVFPETGIKKTEAQATLLRAKEKEERAFMDARQNLLEEILQGYLSEQRLILNRKNLRILEKELEAAVEKDTIRSLEQSILSAKRRILQSEQELENIDPSIGEHISRLYKQGVVYTEKCLEELPEQRWSPENSLTTTAQEHTLAAAEQKKGHRYRVYLPNPEVQLGIEYDLYENDMSWNVSVEFSAPLLDRGERAYEVFRRKEQPEIERLKLQESFRSLTEEYRQIRSRLELLEYDKRLQKYSIEDAIEEEEYTERMYRGGFINEEAYISAKLDRKQSELEMKEIEHSLILQKLQLLRMFTLSGGNNG